MDATPIDRMRDRARQLRRIADSAHDREMIQMLRKMADEVDLDASRLEAELSTGREGDETASSATAAPVPPARH